MLSGLSYRVLSDDRLSHTISSLIHSNMSTAAISFIQYFSPSFSKCFGFFRYCGHRKSKYLFSYNWVLVVCQCFEEMKFQSNK